MIFNLQSVCCKKQIEYVKDEFPPYVCSECKTELKVRDDILTPCCNATPYVLKNEDAWQCTQCESTWDFLGNLLFMDTNWSYKEGVDFAI